MATLPDLCNRSQKIGSADVLVMRTKCKQTTVKTNRDKLRDISSLNFQNTWNGSFSELSPWRSRSSEVRIISA